MTIHRCYLASCSGEVSRYFDGAHYCDSCGRYQGEKEFDLCECPGCENLNHPASPEPAFMPYVISEAFPFYGSDPHLAIAQGIGPGDDPLPLVERTRSAFGESQTRYVRARRRKTRIVHGRYGSPSPEALARSQRVIEGWRNGEYAYEQFAVGSGERAVSPWRQWRDRFGFPS